MLIGEHRSSCHTPMCADNRNNHIDKHYDEIAKLADEKSLKKYDIRLVAVVWDVKSQPYHRLLRVCSERVVKRGDNHQTLRPDLTAEAEHEAVVGNFLRNWTAPDPEMFDKLISVPIEQSPQDTLRMVVDGLVDVLGLTQPSEKNMAEALKAAGEYKPSTPYHAPAVKFSKAVRYFGVAPEMDLPATVSSILASHPDSPAAVFFKNIQDDQRITARPHITLAHNKVVEAEKEARAGEKGKGSMEVLWDTCKSLAEMPIAPRYEFEISLLVWDDRVMALALDHILPQASAAEAGSGAAPQLIIPESIASYLHVTVGTRSEEIAAFESRGIVKAAREAIKAGKETAEEVVPGGGTVRWIRAQGISGEGRVKGMS